MGAEDLDGTAKLGCEVGVPLSEPLYRFTSFAVTNEDDFGGATAAVKIV